MASADEVFPASDCCEICGAVLGDEVVIQEFADGSLARLCPECAAGADLDDGASPATSEADPSEHLADESPTASRRDARRPTPTRWRRPGSCSCR